MLVNKRFREAISRMTPEELAGWLARGADPNTDAKPGGWCPLARAARSPFTDDALVEALLAAGAQAGRMRDQLIWVAHSSTDRKMHLLIEAGADVTVTCSLYHRSVVSQLIPWADVETIRLALVKGAGLEMGWPLHKAVYAGRPELVALFLAWGADKEAIMPRDWMETSGFVPSSDLRACHRTTCCSMNKAQGFPHYWGWRGTSRGKLRGTSRGKQGAPGTRTHLLGYG